MRVNLILITFLALVLGACAPMPGPLISTSGISKMSIEELLQHADAHRDGNAPMFDLWEDLQCKPFSAYDAYRQGRIRIFTGTQLEVTAICAKKICAYSKAYCAFMILGPAPPLGCYVAYVHGDCKQYTDIYVTDSYSKHSLLHEIRHAQGYADLLY